MTGDAGTTDRTALLLPGQGGYLPGVFHHLATTHPVVGDLLTEIDALAAGRPHPRGPVSGLLTSREAPSLQELVETDPALLHLAIFAAGTVAHRLLTEEYGVVADVLLGHSFGEITALTAAGVYGLAQGVELVCLRDDAFEAAGPPKGGMLVLDTGLRRAEHLVGAVDAWDAVIAADNGPDQVVVSGEPPALDALAAVAGQLGLRATRLRVPYPFHNPLLAPVADRFARWVADVPRSAAAVRVFSPLLGREVVSDGDVVDVVVGHLTRPVGFLGAVRALHGLRVRRFVECGPRATLTDLVGAALPAVTCAAPFARRAGSAEVRSRLLGAQPEQVSVPAPAPPPVVQREAAGLDEAAVLTELRTLYSEAVGYPVEAFEAGADLEADLGIDSVQQTEVLTRLLARHDLRADQANGSVRVKSYPTLESLAGLVVELSRTAAKARS